MWYRDVVAAAQQRREVFRQALPIQTSSTLTAVLNTLAQSGKRALVVGGAVRDALQGKVPKDIDVEVYGTSYDELVHVLSQFGRTDLVGKSFGVIKLTDREGNDFDFSIPRRDNKVGSGHKDFQSTFDPTITPKEAAARRDFTFNALAYDPLSQEVHDYYGGEKDLKSGILRATSPAFAEDPLRVLRGMQFAARFGMRVDPATARMCQQIAGEYKHLPKERVGEEFMKLFTKGKKPSMGLQFLIDTGWIKNFPELANMVDVPQDEEWHPEGPVHTHTGLVADAAVEYCDEHGIEGDARAAQIAAAITHDMAKAHTTEQRIKNGRMRWTAHGHELAGGPLADSFLNSIGIKKEIIRKVRPIVERHLEHIRFKPDADNVPMIRQLADDLHPANIDELTGLMYADASGRHPLPKGMPEQARLMHELAMKEGVHLNRPVPFIQGRDVMPYFGNRGGPHVGEAVKAAYNAQLAGKINNPEQAQAWLNNFIKGRASILRGQDVMPYFGGKGGPEVGDVLNHAWEAQRAGHFADPDTAKTWLDQHMQQRQQAPIDPVPKPPQAEAV